MVAACAAQMRRHRCREGEMIVTERLYHLDPIDFWDGWTSEYDYLRKLFTEYPNNNCGQIAAYIGLRAKAERMALKAGWDGDIREGVFVSALPPTDGRDSCPIMLAWKQDNNGETFVYSPWPLPWLETRR
jgi:hypothetical protein